MIARDDLGATVSTYNYTACIFSGFVQTPGSLTLLQLFTSKYVDY